MHCALLEEKVAKRRNLEILEVVPPGDQALLEKLMW